MDIKYLVIDKKTGRVTRYPDEGAMLNAVQDYETADLEVWEVKRPVVLFKRPAVVMVK